MEINDILGRDKSIKKEHGSDGCCFLGKSVSYPGGEYEEMGKVYLDIVSPHCVLIVGKRGTGKSYTLGVMAEGFAKLKQKYADKIALVLIDTMSVFHSLKKENTNHEEIDRMQDFDIEPKSFTEKVRVLVPKIAIDKAEGEGYDLFYDEVFTFPLYQVTIDEWLDIFDMKITEPIGTLLSKVISRLKDKGYFSFEDIYKEIEYLALDEEREEALKNQFKIIEKVNLFSEKGMDETIAKGGKITVLDLSYLGRLGNYALRNLIISIFARKMITERTLYTTVEMQSQAGLIDSKKNSDITEDHPLVYMLIDEAHLFLPSEKETLATATLIDWIKLGRHPGLSLILATQEPSALHESAIRQSDMIIAHNLTAKDDVAALGMAKQTYMREGLDEIVAQMEYKRGLAIVFDDKTRTMQLCRVRPRHTLHTGVDASAMPRD
ncbi:MAG: ATP-binding protein [Thermoplasmatota archaeon]